MEKIPKKFQIFPAPNYKARKKKISPHQKNICGWERGVGGGGRGGGENMPWKYF